MAISKFTTHRALLSRKLKFHVKTKLKFHLLEVPEGEAEGKQCC